MCPLDNSGKLIYMNKYLFFSNFVEGKIYFAGTSYTRKNDWGGVQNATRSAKDAVEKIRIKLKNS